MAASIMAEPKIEDEDPQLNILLCGRSGVGKSSLVNSLLGQEVCTVSRQPDLDPCTKDTTKFTVNLDGITVNVFDSPGLQDGTEDETEYVEKMYSKCKNVDLVLYCMDMTEVRFTPAEVRAIGTITNKFGRKIWERCVLVLTKANCLHVPRANRAPLATIDYHENVFKNFLSKFCLHLEKVGVSKSDLQNHTVAAGLFDCDTNDKPDCLIYYASKHVKASIKIVNKIACSKSEELELVDFISELWVTCLCRLPTESRNRYLQATALGGRVTVNGDDSRQSEELREILEKAAKELNISIRKSVPVPIRISHPSQRQRILNALKHYAPAAAVGGLGGVIAGAAIGMFTAGPVGAVVGGFAGAAGGAAVGASGRAVYSWFTGSKKDKTV